MVSARDRAAQRRYRQLAVEYHRDARIAAQGLVPAFRILGRAANKSSSERLERIGRDAPSFFGALSRAMGGEPVRDLNLAATAAFLDAWWAGPAPTICLSQLGAVHEDRWLLVGQLGGRPAAVLVVASAGGLATADVIPETWPNAAYVLLLLPGVPPPARLDPPWHCITTESGSAPVLLLDDALPPAEVVREAANAASAPPAAPMQAAADTAPFEVDLRSCTDPRGAIERFLCAWRDGDPLTMFALADVELATGRDVEFGVAWTAQLADTLAMSPQQWTIEACEAGNVFVDGTTYRSDFAESGAQVTHARGTHTLRVDLRRGSDGVYRVRYLSWMERTPAGRVVHDVGWCRPSN